MVVSGAGFLIAHQPITALLPSDRYPQDVTVLAFFDNGHNGLFVAIGGVRLAVA